MKHTKRALIAVTAFVIGGFLVTLVVAVGFQMSGMSAVQAAVVTNPVFIVAGFGCAYWANRKWGPAPDGRHSSGELQ